MYQPRVFVSPCQAMSSGTLRPATVDTDAVGRGVDLLQHYSNLVVKQVRLSSAAGPVPALSHSRVTFGKHRLEQRDGRVPGPAVSAANDVRTRPAHPDRQVPGEAGAAAERARRVPKWWWFSWWSQWYRPQAEQYGQPAQAIQGVWVPPMLLCCPCPHFKPVCLGATPHKTGSWPSTRTTL